MMTAPVMTEERTSESQTDDPKVAHYVRRKEIVDSSVFGTYIITLCNQKLIPTRNPDNLPICVPCKKIYDSFGNDSQ